MDIGSRNSYPADALRAAGDATFTHNIGKIKKDETVLTVQEFCHR